MTNTIPNVPRELLERVTKYCVSAPDAIKARNEVRALLSAPSPAGVDWLKPAAMIRRKSPLGTEYACEAISYNLPNGTELCRLSDAQAIIDGLRGEVERLQRAEKNDAIAYKAALERQDELRTERNQQAQRIGELEGLLRDSAELIKHGVFEDGICCCGASVDSHGFGDGHSPVDALAYHAGQVCERIDAALPSSKDSGQ